MTAATVCNIVHNQMNPTNRRGRHRHVKSAAHLGARLKAWRLERRHSIRGLAALAGVSASLISKIEAGKVSPTVATLLKLTKAMRTDLHDFFRGGAAADPSTLIVFKQGGMVSSADPDRAWRFAFPWHPSIKAQLTYEEYQPHTRVPEKERHQGDLCGYVLAGELTLEVQGQGVKRVAAGDAFYIRSGQAHTARNESATCLKLVAVQLR